MGFDWEGILGEGNIQRLYEDNLYEDNLHYSTRYDDTDYSEKAFVEAYEEDEFEQECDEEYDGDYEEVCEKKYVEEHKEGNNLGDDSKEVESAEVNSLTGDLTPLTIEEKRIQELATIILGNKMRKIHNVETENGSKWIFYGECDEKLYFLTDAEIKLYETGGIINCDDEPPFSDWIWSETWKMLISEKVISDKAWCIWLLASDLHNSSSYEKYDYTGYNYEEICEKLRMINNMKEAGNE